MTDAAFIFLMALVLDLLLGEPPNPIHPVAWMGRWLQWVGRAARARASQVQLVIGGVGVLTGLLAAWLLTSLLLRTLEEWAIPIRLGVSAMLLKLTLSCHRLLGAAEEVRQALVAQELTEARRLVGWHLVSRPTAELSEEEIAGATVESLAENFTDAVVAPILYWLLGGIPLAMAYRFINTADAMWGYRNPMYEYLGKVAARLDDAVNWLPARIATALLLLGGGIARGDLRNGLRVFLRDHAATASPNAGWTMSAMAGLLQVRLTKRGAYALGDGAVPVNGLSIVRAQRFLVVAMFLLVAAILIGLSLDASRIASLIAVPYETRGLLVSRP